MAFAVLANRTASICRRVRTTRLMRFSRYAFCNKAPPTRLRYWKNGIGAGLLLTCVGTIYVQYHMSRTSENQMKKTEKREREIMFTIKEEIRMPFPRTKERKEWKKFIDRCFAPSDGFIYWMYGDKNIGKSTMLKSIAYELQKEHASQIRDKQILYINLEGTGQKTKDVIYQLRKAITENARKGIQSRIIFDAVGMLSVQERQIVLSEDATQEEFNRAVWPRYDWVDGWFAFVKECCDEGHSRFIFLTSKPFHLAINQRGFAYRIRDRSGQIDVNKQFAEELRLKLSKKDAIAYIQHQQSIERRSIRGPTADSLIKEIEEMDTNSFESSDLCKIGCIKSRLYMNMF